tara:strand:+ start:1068 stop:1430 length:363 start_codon:yes stop_codon:yes gene_type:complete
MSLIKIGYSHIDKEYKSVDFIIEADERLWSFVEEQLFELLNVDLREYKSTRLLKSDLESPFTTWYTTNNVEIVVNPNYVSRTFYRWLDDQGFTLIENSGLLSEDDTQRLYDLQHIFESWD